MSLYPTLEDMKADQIVSAQNTVASQHMAIESARAASGAAPLYPSAVPGAPSTSDPVVQTAIHQSLYPSLGDYMGMELQPYVRQGYQNQEVSPERQVAVRQTATGQLQVAPLTGNDFGLQRAQIKDGIRQIILCKDKDAKVGLRVRHVNKGVFVAFVYKASPAALVGLRFGDQILQINGVTIAGWDADKVHKFVKNADGARITMAVRDRPFERVITMHKDSSGHIGFTFKDGVVNAIVKESSAARNGLLTDHKLIEIGGQNVVGLKDKEITKISNDTPSPVTVTIMPVFVYEHIVKCMGSSLVKNKMDHSIPDL